MKKGLIVLFIIFAFNLFAGIYKVCFVNGGILVLKEKPDFSKERIIGVTPDGKKIVFLKKLVDFEKTEKANAPKKKVIEKTKKTIKVIPSKPKPTKEPLIITEATVGKKKTDKDKKDLKKKEKNPFMSWKEEAAEGDLRDTEAKGVSPIEGMSEKEAEKYWRSQFIRINTAIAQTEKSIRKVEEELNRLMTEKLNTDDNIVIMRINGEMEKLEKKKKELKKSLENLKREKEKLKDKARKSGALPGWYRDLI